MSAEIKLSKRLQEVADFVPQGARLADIGSDHAYLPAYLVEHGRIDFAVAGEVVAGPYEISKRHVRERGLHNNICVKFANGLAAIDEKDEIDCVTIAGMGGLLISEILEAGIDKLENVDKLILQPNKHEKELRQWLNLHNYNMVNETILKESGKFYEVILAEKGQESLSELDLTFGPCLIKEKSPIFQEKWQKEAETLRKILARLPENQEEKRKVLQAKAAQIQEVLQ